MADDGESILSGEDFGDSEPGATGFVNVGLIGSGGELEVDLVVIPVGVFSKFDPGETVLEIGGRVEEAVSEGIVANREEGGGVLADCQDGSVVAFGLMEDGTEGGVVLAGKEVGVNAAWVDAGEGVIAIGCEGEGACR